MKTYKFNNEETADIYGALVAAVVKAKIELEEDNKLNLTLSCKSIVELDKRNYFYLKKLKEIFKEHNEIKIEGE